MTLKNIVSAGFKIVELNGRYILLYQNHTFSKIGLKNQIMIAAPRRFFDRNWQLKEVCNEHNHHPPHLVVTADGKYFNVHYQERR